MASESEITFHKFINFNTTQVPPQSTDHNSPQNHSVQPKWFTNYFQFLNSL